MSKQEQVLAVDPPTELRFRGPFTSQVTSYMKLFNPVDKKVCFKIKTTAPKKYCVRPNCGIIDPNARVEIAVSLQPFEYDPAEKNKHKFMVLSTICPEGETNLDAIWASVKADETMDSKLKCVFEMPADAEDGETVVPEEVVRVAEAKPVAAKPREAVESADIVKDFQNLRMEESHLRQENMELKEEILRLTRANAAALAAAAGTNQGAQYRHALQEPQPRNLTDLAIALVVALVGIILGKFFF